MKLLKLPVPPTAIFSSNYDMTLGLLRAVTELKVPCPSQVSILSFDDFAMGDGGFSWATIFSPALTAVAQPSFEIGKIAMQSLLQEVEDKLKGLRGSKRAVVKLKAELRIRDSTAPPPAESVPFENQPASKAGADNLYEHAP